MHIGDIAKLQEALEYWDRTVTLRDEFIANNQDEDGGEPTCGYSEWDEEIADFNDSLAEKGELLADAIREVLG